MSNQEEINSDVRKRKIRWLCHFTQSRKLSHILGEAAGIYSIEWLKENRPDIFDQNDSNRLDGYPNYINCSIEYPNTWFLNKAKKREVLFTDWSILLLKADLLWLPKTRFAYRNAAAISSNIKEGFEAYSKMFADSITGAYGKTFTRDKNHVPSCPTDGQAEVLIYQHIPIDQIIGIVFADKKQAKLEIDRLDSLKIKLNNIDIYIAPHFFDHSWRTCIEKGQVPKEIILNKDEIND
jgi:hypothetical protein